MSLLQLAAKNIEKKAPYRCEKTLVLTNTGEVRQNQKLANLIMREQSSHASGSGITVYVLRIDSVVVDAFGNTVFLSYNDSTKKIGLHYA